MIKRPDNRIPNISGLKKNYQKDSFWFLSWIGGVFFYEGKKFVDFYFINIDFPSQNCSKKNEDVTIAVSCEFYFTTYYTVGCVFDSEGKLRSFPGQSEYHCDIVNIDYNDQLNYKKEKIGNLPCDRSYPIPKAEFDYDLEYLSSEKIIDNRKLKILINPILICNYLYFKSEYLTDILISQDWTSYFVCEETTKENKVVGTLVYDNYKISKEEAYCLAPFFFMEEDTGVKSINLISSHLTKEFIKNKSQQVKKRIYIKTTFPFSSKVQMQLLGRRFIFSNEEYFLCYKINELVLSEKKIFSVDTLNLIPKFPNFSESSLINKRKGILYQKKLKCDYYQSDKYYNGILFPFDYFYQKSQNFTLRKILDKVEVSEIHRKFQLQNQFNTLNYIDFILKTIEDKLTEKYLCAAGINKIHIGEKETKIVLHGFDFRFTIFEINIGNNFFYLINFNGQIGLISEEKNREKIMPLILKLFSEKIINDYLIYADFLFWFQVKSDQLIFNKDFGIQIHNCIDCNYEKEGVSTTAEKIINKIEHLQMSSA